MDLHIMTIDRFWDLIGEVHRESGGDMDAKCDLLRTKLGQLAPDEMRSFRLHFEECNRRAYDWGLWGAAYVIEGGCSDDGFSDFRSTLISQGREVFEAALNDPDSLADLPFVEDDPCYEGYAYAVTDAEGDVCGEIAPRSDPFPKVPSGEAWDEDDDEALAARFPKLHAKFG